MSDHFTLSDLLRIAGAFFLYPIILVAPGYVVCWLTGALDFRRRHLATRLALAVPTSIGICPILNYLLGRWLPPYVWLLYGSATIAFLFLLFSGFRKSNPMNGITRGRLVFFGVAGAWAVLAALILTDLQIGHHLYFPFVTFDYALRAPVTAAITRGGIPPHNPLFFPGHFYTLRYHYFWYILCSAVQHLGGSQLSARQAMIAGSIWCGIGLMALIPLYLRFFLPGGKHAIGRRGLVGIALLCVTGLDIIPVLLVESSTRRFLGSLEWWNEQVTAWVNIALWVPHHLAGLIACLTGFLFVWDAERKPDLRSRLMLSAAAGCMFASAAGLTIYVTLVFAVCLAAWLAVAMLRKQRGHAGLLCISGVTAILLATPFLLELLAPAPGGKGGPVSKFPLEFQVRNFPLFTAALGLSNPQEWKTALANLIALPLNYLFELGFFLIAGAIYCRRMWRNRRHLTESQVCAFTLAATSIVASSFVKSSVIGANDFGWRGMMIAQFVLLLWGAELLSGGLEALGEVRILVVMALFFGVAGSVYDVLKIRFLPVLSDNTPAARTFGWLSLDDKLGERTYELRRIYEELRRRTGDGVVVQHNPNVSPQDNFHGLYADRQLAAETTACGAVFGGDAGECAARIGAISDFFEKPSLDPSEVDNACRKLSIDFLVAQKADKVWSDRSSWIWKRTPVIANDYARVFPCGLHAKADLP